MLTLIDIDHMSRHSVRMLHQDQTIRLDAPLFVHGEARSLTNLDRYILNSWIDRKVVNLGTKNRTKRRLYSIIDLIKLRVIADLAQVLKMSPSFAVAISESVLPRAQEVAANPIESAKGEAQYLVAWAEPKSDLFTVRRVKAGRLPEVLAQPHPVIVVPLDEIARTITIKALSMLEEDGK